MSIFLLLTNSRRVDGSFRYDYVEAPFETVADFVAELRTGPVACEKLSATRDEAKNKMVISGRHGLAVTASYVAAIEVPNLPFIEG